MKQYLILFFFLSISLVWATPAPLIKPYTQIGGQSGNGWYNITTEVWFEQLYVNSTNVTFYGLHANNQSCYDVNSGALLCNSTENCTLPIVTYIRNLTFNMTATTSVSTTTTIPTTTTAGSTHPPTQPSCSHDEDCYYFQVCFHNRCYGLDCNSTQMAFNHTCIDIPTNLTDIFDMIYSITQNQTNLSEFIDLHEAGIELSGWLEQAFSTLSTELTIFFGTPLFIYNGYSFTVMLLVLIILVIIAIIILYREYNKKKRKQEEMWE